MISISCKLDNNDHRIFGALYKEDLIYVYLSDVYSPAYEHICIHRERLLWRLGWETSHMVLIKLYINAWHDYIHSCICMRTRLILRDTSQPSPSPARRGKADDVMHSQYGINIIIYCMELVCVSVCTCISVQHLNSWTTVHHVHVLHSAYLLARLPIVGSINSRFQKEWVKESCIMQYCF